MPYLYHTDEDRKQMLADLGLSSEDELFESVPEKFRVAGPLAIGDGRTEFDTVRHFRRLAAQNRPASTMTSFLGGGVYDHIIPAVVDHLSGRSEYYTAYTPYQAEVSQGTLQVIFEFQTMISRLTRLPVANASMYDGATALAESALMAVNITKRSELVCMSNVNPRYKSVLSTYARGRGVELTMVPVAEDGAADENALRRCLSNKVAAVLVQTPNYFGVLEAPWEYQQAVHDAGALLVACVDPGSLALFTPPGDYGADIVVGEGQGLGNKMNFGGPMLGFMACQEKYIRNLPGRLVSQTTDIEGKRAYVLTLQTREQHIRRGRATSNICTNQGLLAIRATVYLAALGESGLNEMARLCFAKAHRLSKMIADCPGFSLRFTSPFYHEFVVRCPVKATEVVEKAREANFLAGIPLDKYFGEEARNDLLVAVTEKRSDEELEGFCEMLRSI
ncbi:MAG: aminomethyl-transferring glycine dehydrogenase subunit GcvPA [Candidatus Krumholzibacteria bacterium]|nr:aminomethyl-transferring glycine dehydrogenase subunit GcvPA [Candidatus Krumholzibacteria bacterium]